MSPPRSSSGRVRPPTTLGPAVPRTALFPRGAIVLSVLSLAYFATGIVRNRVFANTYGAGAELDAYNAAFRIPEIALDVLVAAGLTARSCRSTAGCATTTATTRRTTSGGPC